MARCSGSNADEGNRFFLGDVSVWREPLSVHRPGLLRGAFPVRFLFCGHDRSAAVLREVDEEASGRRRSRRRSDRCAVWGHRQEIQLPLREDAWKIRPYAEDGATEAGWNGDRPGRSLVAASRAISVAGRIVFSADGPRAIRDQFESAKRDAGGTHGRIREGGGRDYPGGCSEKRIADGRLEHRDYTGFFGDLHAEFSAAYRIRASQPPRGS